MSKCIFCKKENLKILYENAKFIIIPDIRPASTKHYLVIPKEHHKNVKYLTSNHLSLVEEMKETGLKFAAENIEGFSEDESLIGFHWAPFNTIEHLHLHVIFPKSNMGFFSKLLFRPSFAFCEIDSAIDYLRARS